ncbi:hypothetical protein BU23DRAFT_602202 [Bimuria novae-zelandiae CBS 107.79]|uniref:Uncharacterized protein n=1 Tax=Bimuria novae-zelandiae CBS 107.79 TaxID=1447943 RepID=A0A6A5UU17_9PLEO|nr:hypothetical protein BU23DRAFT_602202 [Bimuria novae-zelandiae CBS 107.79]
MPWHEADVLQGLQMSLEEPSGDPIITRPTECGLPTNIRDVLGALMAEKLWTITKTSGPRFGCVLVAHTNFVDIVCRHSCREKMTVAPRELRKPDSNVLGSQLGDHVRSSLFLSSGCVGRFQGNYQLKLLNTHLGDELDKIGISVYIRGGEEFCNIIMFLSPRSVKGQESYGWSATSRRQVDCEPSHRITNVGALLLRSRNRRSTLVEDALEKQPIG